MIIECGACLGLKLKYFYFRIIFLLIHTHTEVVEVVQGKEEKFAQEKCHIKVFSPKSKFSSSWAGVVQFKTSSRYVHGSSNVVINSFVTEMNSSEFALH